jgi:hypothetical protein
MESIGRIRVTFAAMRYAFLVETYATERVKVVSVWSEFRDEDLPVRPRESDTPRIAGNGWRCCRKKMRSGGKRVLSFSMCSDRERG